MKTFTTYAEKKANKFFNLLQNYTKGIRITAMLMLLIVGTSNAWGVTYYYRGDNNNWGATAMTVSDDGFYSYYDASYWTHKFKISTSTSGWEYNYSYVTAQFNSTDISDIGDFGKDNCYIWQNCKHYVLVYHPNTTINTTSKPIICAATYLPDNSPEKTVYLKPNDTWKANGARFAIYHWDNRGNNGWYSMLPVGCTDNPEYYSGVVPFGHSNIIFVRMDGSNSTNDWNNKKDYQTADLKKQGGTLYTISNSQWSAYTAPTYTITTNAGTGGTISVSPASPVTVGTDVTVTITANSGYRFKSGTITIGNNDATSISSGSSTHSICGPTTINATFEVSTYTVTFNANGHGTAPTAQTVNHGAKATKPTDPTATGYTFGGWYKESACTNAFDFNTTITDDITLYAKWTAKTYTVTLNNQGATTAGATTVTATYDSAMPSIAGNLPAKTGYTFNGYFTATTDGTQYYKADGSSAKNWNIASNSTLYAKWTPIKYNITYKDQGGSAFTGTHASGHPTTHTYGTATTLKTATKTGYTFDGWFTNSDCTGTAVTSLGATAYTANITLYAKWTAVPTTIYLKPSATWKYADARFAIYAWGGDDGDKWVDMTTVGCDDEYYTADIPAGYTDFKFVRLDPAKTENNWSNRWCETGNLTIPDDGKNLFDMTQMYLNATGIWDHSNARFAAYFYVNGNSGQEKWMSMSHVKDNIYKCDIPDDYNFDWVIFCRMDGNISTNDWNNSSVWNQTSDLELTTYSVTHGNYFTITAMGSNGEKSSGSWSWNDIAWSTLDLPTITITNNNPDYGSITVTTADGTEITSGTQVDWDTEVIVSILPNSGYSVQSSSIQIGNKAATTIQQNKRYTICNNTTISVSFEEKSEYYIIGIDGDWVTFQEKYKFVDGKLLLSLEADGNKTFKIAKVKGGNLQDRYGKANTYTFKGNINTAQLESANAAEGGDHCILEPVHNGDFLFVWDENTTTLTIEYPDVCFLHGGFNGWKDKAPHALHDRDAIVYLTAGNDYVFKVAEKGIYYTAKDYTTKMTQTGDSKTMDDDTNYNTDPYHNCIVNATVTGRYIFHFDSETRILTITCPKDMTPASGDYRLIYQETGKKDHPSNIVKKRTDNGQDTVSLYIHKGGTSPQVLLQQFDGSTWTTTATYNVADMIAIQNDTHEDQGNGVWNFIIQQNNNKASVLIDASHPERYTGNYYIRTDCADGGWDEYPIPENKMTFASYSKEHCNFSHYFCKWVQDAGVNVKYTIANDYSEAITDSLTADVKTLEGTELADNEKMVTGETVPAKANIRFSWNEATNVLHRAYISGATYVSERFLVLEGDDKLKNDEGYTFTGDNQIEGLNEHETSFADLQNWIYQVDVYASKYTKVKLSAKYNNKVQYFVGAQEAVNLINSSSEKDYKIRIIYDFKTNHLIAAWLAGGNTVDEEGGETLGADLMIIRRNQSAIEQLTFTPNNNPLRTVETAYAVTTFDKTFITNSSLTPYERSLYWISFPFDVKISDVFGFGEYGEHWIMEYYDGAARAKNGLWADTDTYWKYITNKEYTLKAGTGYVLALNLSKVISSFIHDVADVSLYFPSKDYLGDIDGTLPESVTIPAHTCTITRDNRNIYDSHWNLIGVPGFADITGVNTTPNEWQVDSLSFYFEYLPQTDEYRTQTTYRDNNTFRTMFSYMVQYTGTINWTTPASLSAIAARRIGTMPDKYSLRLEMAQNDELVDQTYIELHENKATADFDMNIDLTKILNNSANIYTLTANTAIMVAGNALPMEKVTVPVGVMIATAGTYTFRMPDGTDGIAVTLVDNVTGTHTNMLMNEYTVTLNAGTIENRFYLVVDPDRTATSVENVGSGANGDEAKGVEKFLIDGKLFIRTTDGIFDAKGQRL